MAYTGNYRELLLLGRLFLGLAMIVGILPYICLWLVVGDLIVVALNWTVGLSQLISQALES